MTTRTLADGDTDMETTHWGGPGEDYRLSKISAASISEDNGIGAPAPDDAAPVWQPPKAIHSFPWFEMVMTVIGVLGVIGLTLYMLTPEATGYFALVKTTLLALIPLVIVVGFLIRIDRWEPEPWKTKISVFLWGAGVATLSAGILNTALHHNIAYSTGDAQGASALSATFVAPLVEETLKGVVVLIVVLVRRTNINSVLDGVVYAGFSAAGFMFTEDILYFLRGEAEGTTNLIVLVVMRGIFSPFLHVMATSMTGIGLALALLKFKRGWSKAGIVAVFWVCAMGIHFLWNGSASYGGGWFLVLYAVVQVPAFILWSVLLLRATRKEAEKIRTGLVPYVRTGWVLPGEVTMATDKRSRRAALKWAARGGRDAKKAMRSFLANLASLGLDQRLMAKHGPDPARIENDRQMLTEAADNRREFLRLTSIAEQQHDVSKAVSSRARAA